jgi:predicted DNA-binding transcriptional regulator YafY
MRASRLLSILMTLQAKGRVTAQFLAEDCEVSIRTIYRDIDALSAAGIPVYADRGPEGGYRLIDGYCTRLTGMTAEEAEAVLLSGLTGAAADLGIGALLASAQRKLLAALPADLRANAERISARFHLDAPGWFGDSEQPAHLPAIAKAIWDQRMISIRYRSWKSETQRSVAPLGVVLKGGAWYMVGKVNGKLATFRVARILEFSPTEVRFERPDSFDLADYWTESTRRLDEEMHPNEATIRLSPVGLRLMEPFLSPYSRARAKVTPGKTEQDWSTIVLPTGSFWETASLFLRFGAEIEVLAPTDLRTRLVEMAAAIVERHGVSDQPARTNKS